MEGEKEGKGGGIHVGNGGNEQKEGDCDRTGGESDRSHPSFRLPVSLWKIGKPSDNGNLVSVLDTQRA